jgi:uncharacterized protein YjbI with pentapeptide repeats
MNRQSNEHRDQTYVLDLHGAFLRRVDLSGTNLAGANFIDTDFTNANLRGSNFKDTKLKGTSLRGADLREAGNLTWEQLEEAVIDQTTLLPDYLTNDPVRSHVRHDRQGEPP